MLDDGLAFLGAIAEEVDGMLAELFREGVLVDDHRLNRQDGLQGPCVERGIDLHASSIKHRTEERILGQVVVHQQDRHALHLQCRYGDELQVASVCHSLRHRHTDAQARVAARTGTHRHAVERNGMIVGEGKSLVHHRAENGSVVRSLLLLGFVSLLG